MERTRRENGEDIENLKERYVGDNIVASEGVCDDVDESAETRCGRMLHCSEDEGGDESVLIDDDGLLVEESDRAWDRRIGENGRLDGIPTCRDIQIRTREKHPVTSERD